MSEITLEQVIDFIRKNAYKYDYQIQQELNKIRKISDEEIQEEIKNNYDLYKKLADK